MASPNPSMPLALPTASPASPQPTTLVEHLQALGRTATVVGERLKDPEKITLGEILRLLKLGP